MPLARRPASRIRVIAHVDLDCFYVQVEQRRQPQLRGKPTAVIQYNSWKGGACIAVGYEARKCGVKRSMRGDAAKAVCPDLNLVQVPVLHEKADLSIYRDAGSEVVAVLSRVGKCERASIDEVYLDVTEAAERLSSKDLSTLVSEEASTSHIVGLPQLGTKEWFCRPDASREDHLLACGAIIIADIRLAVLAETEFTCSAGVAHNKMLAKLSSGMHKPAQQTLVPSSAVESLLATLPISKIGKLGGKLGQELEGELGVKTVGDLLQFSELKLQDMYGPNTGTWLWNTARGINGDEVQDRTLPKSHSSGKTFPGPRALKTLETVVYWLKELAETLQLRLDEDLSQNNRTAHLLTIHASCHIFQEGRATEAPKFSSKSRPLRYGVDKIVEDSRYLFERSLHEFCSHQSAGKEQSEITSSWAVTGLSLTASNIMAKPMGVNPITQYFGTRPPVTGDAGNASEQQQQCPSISKEVRLEEDRAGPSVTTDGSIPESISPPPSRKPAKLTDLWQRKASLQPERKEETVAWEYKQEEIDHSVFAELPSEIQQELQGRLGVQRNKRGKPTTIADFFISKT
ncbi:DNA polymerase eta isoform X2 [Selaginella moellendorffii]|uniref:DNA polymerase eta isoform X2 n=1 Tax=Selaginella moellendorffii TaxID=88036 RepID=UPI000D1C93E9|nr:DNA polymerase eta isoform X2 [Selaginella moellendorffii]|eukprot:XP_024529726.1 DNA polymerase eta isoform X2 [Selaginella moellendorffii]